MTRLPEFNPEELDAAQSKIYNKIISGPRGKFGGPFHVLIHAPGIADATQALGAALRFNTRLDPRLREIAILTTARFWRNQVEWNAHVVIAIREDLATDCIEGVLNQKMPVAVAAEFRLVYDFCRELLYDKRVSDAIYKKTQQLIGLEQVVELVSIVGYYGLLAMQLNTFQIAPDRRDGEPPVGLELEDFSELAGA